MKKEIPYVLSVAEKVKLLRKAKNIVQGELADAILSSSTKISLTENGTCKYSDDELEAIKKYFGMPDMPLTEFECAAFKKRLHHWHSLIGNGRAAAEAEELYKKISPITVTDPFDFDLPTLFRLFEVIYLRCKGDVNDAKAKFDFLKSVLDDMNAEHLFYFYSISGWFDFLDENVEGALEHYKKALEITQLNKGQFKVRFDILHYNIANCYTWLDMPYRATFFIFEVRRTCDVKLSESFDLELDAMLASNYIKINKLDEAEKLLNKCLIQAEGLNYGLMKAIIFYELGLLNKKLSNLNKAVEYFDRALDIHEMGSTYHLWALHHKIRCVIESRKFAKSERMLQQAKKLYDAKKEDLILFESLEHLLIISRGSSRFHIESVKYIEAVTIPYLLKYFDYFEALDYCTLLIKHHIASRSRRVHYISTLGLKCSIYDKIFTNY